MTEEQKSHFLLHFEHENGYTSIIEDDGRSCYAYLLKKGEIVSDVWLYNRAEAPIDPEWHDQSKIPFMNPKAYSMHPDKLPNEGDISVFFETLSTGAAGVSIMAFGNVYGRLEEAKKPGWSSFAKRDGPLARVLK